MTPIRRLALKISNIVVRYASPGCKEWAEGLAREVAFVEGDWAALAWALGSVRVLFDHREVPIGSLTDVPVATQKFVKLTRNAAGVWSVILVGPLYVWIFFRRTWWLERAGCVLVVLSSIAAVIFMLMERRRLKDAPSDSIYEDVVACGLFYKAELERSRFSFWFRVSAVYGWVVGEMLAAHGGLFFHSVFSIGITLLTLAAAPFFAVGRRINRRRIERLDELLAERL